MDLCLSNCSDCCIFKFYHPSTTLHVQNFARTPIFLISLLLLYIFCSVHPVDWNDPTHPRSRQEPRRGQRAVLRATVAVPGTCARKTPLVVYCAHFEVFCGMLARIAQLSDIFDDARKLIRKVRVYTDVVH